MAPPATSQGRARVQAPAAFLKFPSIDDLGQTGADAIKTIQHYATQAQAQMTAQVPWMRAQTPSPVAIPRRSTLPMSKPVASPAPVGEVAGWDAYVDSIKGPWSRIGKPRNALPGTEKQPFIVDEYVAGLKEPWEALGAQQSEVALRRVRHKVDGNRMGMFTDTLREIPDNALGLAHVVGGVFAPITTAPAKALSRPAGDGMYDYLGFEWNPDLKPGFSTIGLRFVPHFGNTSAEGREANRKATENYLNIAFMGNGGIGSAGPRGLGAGSRLAAEAAELANAARVTGNVARSASEARPAAAAVQAATSGVKAGSSALSAGADIGVVGIAARRASRPLPQAVSGGQAARVGQSGQGVQGFPAVASAGPSRLRAALRPAQQVVDTAGEGKPFLRRAWMAADGAPRPSAPVRFGDDIVEAYPQRPGNAFEEGIVEFTGGPQRYVSDLSNVTGKAAAARNRAIAAIIGEDFRNLRFTYPPRYSPFLRTGIAKMGEGTQIGKMRFGRRADLRNTITHEELHHRWWERGIYGHHPSGSARERKFYDTIDRYERMRGWKP